MRLALLIPPKDSPSQLPAIPNRIVPAPGEGSYAVNTSALPRALPLPAMDPQAAGAPMQALARLGAAGASVSADVLSTVLQAEAAKRDADNLAVSEALYNKAAMQVDETLETLKTKTDHNTLRPAFQGAWSQITQDAMAEAPNEAVARRLGIKLSGLQVVKNREVNDVTRGKFVDYHEAALSQSAADLGRQATDPGASWQSRDFAIANLRSLFAGYKASGIFPKDRIAAMEERHVTSIHNTLAREAMTKDPEAFLPPSEAFPGGKSGYEAFSANGRYPADPKFLGGLVDTTAPGMVETQRREARLASERRQQATDDALQAAHTQKYDQLMADLTSDDPAKVSAASAIANQAILDSGLYWSKAMKDDIRAAARQTRLSGGTTDPATYNRLYTQILEDPASVTIDQIAYWRSIGALAATGDRSAATLAEKLKTLKKGEDVSQRPDYAVGKSLIVVGLGAPIVTFSAAMDESAQRRAYAYSQALQEFDFRARMPGWETNDLRELGAEIRDKYTEYLYPGGVKPPPPDRKKAP